ncbi:competence protein ComK [Paenibacillus sp. BSR1-1]|uniref:competence protein ComK n=1 Tax=Paenibacillus sp. BSR1-1 TaxID=3020845 RepID=UPI0025B24637|nr:competence protein ComK [Paenibacillus sp. BSR1-1]MDN3015794.1 competence protein ComK [Paenibacillus sp. BSR1-1]
MEIKYNYLINKKTILLYGEIHKNGELYTFVIDGEDMFLVAMPPVKLIDRSLMSYGSNFKGALKSSQLLLGKKRKMYPIKIDGSLDIWVFPTKSYKNENCVWFALNHVKNTQPRGVKFTKICLSNGHTIEIVMKESAFRNKCRQTEELKEIIINNTKISENFLTEPKKGLMIVEKKGSYKCKTVGRVKVIKSN